MDNTRTKRDGGKMKKKSITIKISSHNSTIELCGDQAKKILKTTKNNHTNFRRFKKEVEIIESIQDNYDNIVKIIDKDFSNTHLNYTMQRFEGDSNQLLNKTKGNIDLTLRLLFPIIETLSSLSQKNKIYHRDLKPENLLYSGKDESTYKLILADFGCAYLKTGEENRITAEFRSVGAQAFRAPEYHFGKVGDVDETGDIFSIGKLIWYFINGNKKEVFPYTLWFPEEYDLSKRFSKIKNIDAINLLIAACVNHNPTQRTSYGGLINQIKKITESPKAKIDNKLEKLKIAESKLFSQKQELVQITTGLLGTFKQAWLTLETHLDSNYSESKIVKDFRNMSNRYVLSQDQVINNAITKGGDYPIINIHLNNLTFISRLSASSSFTGTDKKYPAINILFRSKNLNSIDKAFGIQLGFTQNKELVLIQYAKPRSFENNFLIDLFEKSIAHISTDTN